jgi:outer membrane protein
MFKRFLLGAVLTFFPATAVFAISLDEAILLGLQQNPGQLAIRAQTAAAEATAKEAASRTLPRVNLSENLLWTNEPGGSLFISLNQQRLELSPTADAYNDAPARSDFATRLTLVQPLFNPDIIYGRQRAERQAEAAAAREDYGREQLSFAILSAYLSVQRAEANRLWVDSSLKEAQEIMRIAETREQSGLGLKADTLSARVQLSESEQLRISADNAIELAKRNLALQAGSDAKQLEIDAPLTAERLLPLPDPGSLQRADLQALSLQEAAARLAEQQSRAAWLPRLGFSASYALHDRDYPFGAEANDWTVQAGLTWELFDGFSRRQATSRAGAELHSLSMRRRQARREADFALQQAQLKVTEIRQQLVARRDGREAAAESYRLLLERYQNGLSSLTDLLAAQTRLERSRAGLVAGETQLLLALANVHQANGTLLHALFGEERTAE